MEDLRVKHSKQSNEIFHILFFATGTKLLLKSRLTFICYFVISANRYIVYNHCHCNKKVFVLYELGSLMLMSKKYKGMSVFVLLIVFLTIYIMSSFSFLPSWYNLQASVSVSLQYKCAVTPVCRCWLWRNKNVWSALLVFWPFRRECAVYPACVRICVVGECVAIRGTRFYFVYGPVAEPRQCPIHVTFLCK